VQNLAADVGSKFQNLQASHQELKQGHQTLLGKLDDMAASISKLTDLFGTKKKDKGDRDAV
jgi:energy-converting hydrogenase A subunit M